MPLLPAIRHQIVCCVTTIIKELHSLLAELTSHDLQPARRQPIPYHTSKITGHEWVLELIAGNPNCIHHELGIKKEVFLCLIQELHQAGHCNSRRVTLEEQVAIFCIHVKQVFRWAMWVNSFNAPMIQYHGKYTVVILYHLTDLFSCSYFKQTLDIFTRPPFYTKYVYFPADDSVPSKI
jgi:hypothetical protein